jgi:hypothetical protein
MLNTLGNDCKAANFGALEIRRRSADLCFHSCVIDYTDWRGQWLKLSCVKSDILKLEGNNKVEKSYRYLGSLLLAGILASPLAITAATPPQTKTTKQPSGATTNNAHPWNHNEEQSYQAYRHDNHLGYKAYNKLTPEEQTKYWNWRASHPDNLGHPDSLVGRDNPKNTPPPPSAPAPNSNPPKNQ